MTDVDLRLHSAVEQVLDKIRPKITAIDVQGRSDVSRSVWHRSWECVRRAGFALSVLICLSASFVVRRSFVCCVCVCVCVCVFVLRGSLVCVWLLYVFDRRAVLLFADRHDT